MTARHLVGDTAVRPSTPAVATVSSGAAGGAGDRLRVSVCIPTYRRPAFIRKAVASLLVQTRKPDEIIVVSRRDDDATNAVVEELMGSGPDSVILNPRISEPGFLPPIRMAISEASGDIVALLDDDAEAQPDWLARLLAHYDDPTIGAVGGRCVNYFDGVLQTYPPASTFGRLSWYGRSVGNMYRDAIFDHPVEVSHLMGGNMSVRAELFRRCLPDRRLGNNVSFYWEMDVGLQVKAKGARILYDPRARVDHHSAPRETPGMRTVNADAVYWSSYNYALLMRKHLPFWRRIAYVAYTFLVGGSNAPGLVYLVVAPMRGRSPSLSLEVIPSLRGRWRALTESGVDRR